MSNKSADAEEDITQMLLNSRAAVKHYIDKEGILDLALDDMMAYCETVNKAAKETESAGDAQAYAGKVLHADSIRERLDFLKFIATESDLVIGKPLVSKLWDLLVDRSDLQCDEQAYNKWLIESCAEGSSKTAEIWDARGIGELFQEKLASGDNDFSTLSLDGFHCIKSYFLLENEADNKI